MSQVGVKFSPWRLPRCSLNSPSLIFLSVNVGRLRIDGGPAHVNAGRLKKRAKQQTASHQS